MIHPIITVSIGLILALSSAALTYSTPPVLERTFDGAADFFMQPTSTPVVQDRSEVGSTDGIVIMGILIALIVIIPILLRRVAWLENR